jgi:hypothetical protein
MRTNPWKYASMTLALILLSNIILKFSFASQDFDLTSYQAKVAPGQRMSKPPTVVWEVANTGNCPSKPDNLQMFQWMQKGCALRQPELRQCTLYTTTQTTHSVIGHLVRFCFEGQS